MPSQGYYTRKGGEGVLSGSTLMTGNLAAAWGARLAGVDYVPAYPITPQTEIIETIAKWVRLGQMKGKLVQMDSEHSMLTAAGSASLSGARVFTATSSQGLLYGLEMLYNISGWRAPILLVNVSRGLAAPITLEPDHNDVLAARDSGFLQFHAETCQEVLDLILLGYRVAEDRSVLLPAIVNLDGFYLSFTREKVELPKMDTVSTFLPEYDPPAPLRATKPVSHGATVLSGNLYSYFRYRMHAASLEASEVFRKASAEYGGLFGREYEATEGYMLQDAEYVIVMSNSFTTIGKQVVAKLRERGVAAGLLKLRMLRPFPFDDVAKSLAGRRAVAVFDQNLSPGFGGILYPEILASLYHKKNRPQFVLPVVGGLGGKQLTVQELERVFESLRNGPPTFPDRPDPMYLMREDEFDRAKRNIAIASGGG
ncbi:MAG: pyruvate synthase [Nitrososphaerota archaeon]|nr:pyruvate synthase [Nitrososphaerota archaeon]